MKQYGLIGYPLSHSFSKKYFTEKFAAEQINASYELYPLATIEALPELLSAQRDLAGLNVTIPYKKSVVPYLQHATDAVKGMNACNCIHIKKGQLFGYNTDVIGFKNSLLPQLKSTHQKALILGSGGAAAAVEYVLNELQISYSFVSRRQTEKPGVLCYEDVDQEILEAHTLIINTTPLGMYPNVNDCPLIPYQFITPAHYLFDLVYNPAETLFLRKGAEKGAAIKNGEDMLVIQAEESWNIWNK